MQDAPIIRFNSASEILNFAIAKEIEAGQFYLDWADKVKSKTVRQVLIEFAEEELKHRDLLQQVKNGDNFKTNTKHLTDLRITDHFTVILPESQMSYQDALERSFCTPGTRRNQT